eukprot:CAMPEP_0178431164 /NCGR_PEP_ID=MMETSP0689_2-20121128/31696_1 /TAXON_ID=160604 /ORGANISM="Amphidinium massartii, Strain CS-259" /LENGTH=193 /DNA_ID=CAMNT_0020053047 /DNA_START=165 /DNA_END=744 /DNA_ORIENTATION=-
MVDKALDDIISSNPGSGRGRGRKGGGKGKGRGDKEFWGGGSGEASCPWGGDSIQNFWTHDDRVDDAKPEDPAGWKVEGSAGKGKRGKGKGRMADDSWDDWSGKGKSRKGGKKGGKGGKGGKSGKGGGGGSGSHMKTPDMVLHAGVATKAHGMMEAAQEANGGMTCMTPMGGEVYPVFSHPILRRSRSWTRLLL